MSKIWITATLALFFILGFLFNHYIDFRALEKFATQNSSNIPEAQISSAIPPSSQHITPIQQQPLTISEVIYAQEKQNILSNDSYITPDQNPNFLPIRDWSVPFIEIGAKSAIITEGDASKIFYQKNIREKLPIASLTKLMTAIVVVENADVKEAFRISKSAVDQEGEAGKLIVDEYISIENLLKALLIESSNDAAFALEEYFASRNMNLIDLMNSKAMSLNLKDTHFSSSSGLTDNDNYSTALDYAKLTAYSLNNDEIWDIMKMSSAEIFSIIPSEPTVKKSAIRRLINSNQLLGRLPEIIGGKTGYTTEAKGCLLIATRINNKTIITIVLGSNNRFGETEALINWVKSAYRFD